MNSFETDMHRAVFSWKFLFAAVLQTAVLYEEGFGGTLYLMCIPLICTFPYACGWLDEYKNGFVKLSLSRGTVRGYILGKFFACTFAGGLAEVIGCFVYVLICGDGEAHFDYFLIFLSAMLWAAVAATLAALTNCRYVAYGGAFVIYYFLVILCERYWEDLYCLYPYEWISPKHTWIFGGTGVILLLLGLTAVMCTAFYSVIKRRLSCV